MKVAMNIRIKANDLPMTECILTKMLRLSSYRFGYAILALVAAIAAKPPPDPSPWATYGAGKSVYTKSLGPPGGLDTITVPYGPKAPSFFPKFVDPKTMISSKTDFLSNLFSGMGPATYPFNTPVLYASSMDDGSTNDISDLENIIPTDNSYKNIKRSMFGPMGGKVGPSTSSFGPFAPQFMPGYNSPFAGTGSKFGTASRRKRSVLTSEPASPMNFGPPPPYPGLSTITEESENDMPTSSAGTGIPKQFLPGFFGPFGPFGPAPPSPMIDPSFFASKKTSFLNTLFSSLATSTPATTTDIPVAKNTVVPPGFWSPIETVTAIPIPKSTIVPPGFWAPSSIIPTPGEYTDKVTKFLNKLVESIKLDQVAAAANGTGTDDMSAVPKSKFVRSLVGDTTDKTKLTNSIDDLATVTAAKDAIVNSIVTELGSLKTDMINNLDELILAEKLEVAKASSAATAGKKPMKPFKAAFAGLWGPADPSPSDPFLPFKQKMSTLSEVFDMLTELQRNITIAVADAIKNRVTATDAPPSTIVDPSAQVTTQAFNYMPLNPNVAPPMNVSFWDALKSKLTTLDEPTMNFAASKYARSLTKGPAPLWSSYAQTDAVKRHVDDDDYDSYEDNQHFDDNRNDFKRAVKMSMHQGYQSMPPGTIESVQAGGGSVPGHQGGGIKLLDSQNIDDDESWNEWAKWGDYIKNQYTDQRHHHNHH